jgi:hypothetical protein
MAGKAHWNSLNANPFDETSPKDQIAENTVGGLSNFGALFVRYVRYYEALRAEGVGVEAIRLVREEVEHTQLDQRHCLILRTSWRWCSKKFARVP